MTTDKAKQVLIAYREYLQQTAGVSAVQEASGDVLITEPDDDLVNHLCWMAEKAQEFLDKPEDVDKAHRWLGFIQGAFWLLGDFTIDEMREHNKTGEVSW